MCVIILSLTSKQKLGSFKSSAGCHAYLWGEDK